MVRSTLLLSLLLGATSANAISLGQVDTFSDGFPAGWTEGGPSPNQPEVINDGGPNGAGDDWLQNIATGEMRAGGAQIMFNFSQWAGDYNAAGVTMITASMANFGPTELSMRIAMEGGNGTQIGSAEAVVLPADGQWHEVSFSLAEDQLAVVQGSDTPSEVLSSVFTLRILAAAAGPAWIADFIESDLGVDNIRATAAVVPVPAAAWLMLSSLGLLMGGRVATRS